MSSIKNRDRILEAIDQLRRRKARPDATRICNYLFRKYAINSSEARSDLQWCVDYDIVLKVEYKGNTSYRNAAKKFSHLKRNNLTNGSANNHDDNSADGQQKARKFTQLLTNAFGELIVQDPDYLEFGVPAELIIDNILSKDSVRYTRKYISILLEKEVENGGLIKLANGNYEMGPAGTEEGKKTESQDFRKDIVIVQKEGSSNGMAPQIPSEYLQQHHLQREQSQLQHLKSSMQPRVEYPIIHVKPRKRPGPKPGFRKDKHVENGEGNLDSEERKSDGGGAVRVGVRRKRAKKVFDPSDIHVPKKRGRPAGSLNRSTIEKQLAKLNEESRSESNLSTSSNGREQGGVCSVCHLQNKRGPNDSMVACRECSNKAHYSCLNGDDMMLRMYPDNTWQCPHCKTCVTCYETADAGQLIVCSVCADAYHADCHQPRITEKVRNGTKWLCVNCQMPKELELHDIQSNIGNNTYKRSNTVDSSSSSSDSSASSNYRSNQSSPTDRSSQSPPIQQPSSTGIHPQSSPSPDRHSSDSPDRDSDLDENIDPSIPDATHWTSDQVYQYFAQYFPNEARVFKEQEIDGRSLLLMKRLDVLKNLKLKLGPALKIYRHVVKLQVRRDDTKYYWL